MSFLYDLERGNDLRKTDLRKREKNRSLRIYIDLQFETCGKSQGGTGERTWHRERRIGLSRPRGEF